MRIWLPLACLVFIVSGCNKMEQTKIEWNDFLQFNGGKYSSDLRAELSDTAFIGEVIGVIKHTLNGNIHDPDYESKDGDAAYLEVGTKLYSVINHPHLIAVKDKSAINGYKIFSRESTDFLDFPVFTKRKISKIELHNDEIKKEITNSQVLNEIIRVFQLGNVTDQVSYSQDDIQSFFIILYTSTPFAGKYKIFYDGERYFLNQHNVHIFSDELNLFFDINEDLMTDIS
nr:hypothetical protein [Paenibacillus bovis]